MTVDPLAELRRQIDALTAANAKLSVDNDRLRGENSALAATAAKAVTQEANVLEIRRAHEYASQRCYRCDHPAGAAVKDCPCCANDHTPDSDGTFPEAA